MSKRLVIGAGCTVAAGALLVWYRSSVKTNEEKEEARLLRYMQNKAQREEREKKEKNAFDAWCRDSFLTYCPKHLQECFKTVADEHGISNTAPITIKAGEVVKIQGMLTVGHDIQVQAGGVLIADCIRLVHKADRVKPEISAGRARGAYFKHPFNPDHGVNRSFYGGQPILEFDPSGGTVQVVGEYDEQLKMFTQLRPRFISVVYQ